MGERDPRDSDIATHATITHPDGRQAGNTRRPPDGTAEERDLVGRRLRQFRVVERLGAGGMGVVYKAIDEKLDRPVALKVLAPRYLAEDPGRGPLLLQEARSAAAVAHRNVATIHEVNESEDVSFIAMELIDGETLRARITAGPLPLDEVCHHAREIAAGLACAHATGIVHRDLKPDNAMVTADGHIKLLDFGLARAHELASTESSQRVAGTPAYMSPEQARGEPGDARSDVFAFGATLFELRTGTPPFDRASARPSEWDAPRDWTPRELPRHSGARGLDAIILRCLAYRPEDRYADGGDVAKALDMLATREARPSIARRAIGALVATAVAGSLAAYLWWPRASAAPPPRAVAFVVPMEGVPQDQQWIATVAERRAVAELTAAGRIRVIDAARTGDHPSARQLADPSPVVAARQLAADLDVDRSVVLQANASEPGELTMIATIYDATGDRVATMRAAGRSQDTIALAAQLATEIREQLGVAPAESLDSARMALPATAEAARLYAEGLALRRTFEIAGARHAFEAARDLDPDAPLVHAALAELWTYMGYEERAAAENRRAIELAAPLRREDRLRLEARSAVLAHAWDRAIDAYRALSLLIPEELDDALAIVETMIDAGRVDDAATAIEEVARRPGGVSDPRVTVLRARIASLRGNRALARDTARAARAGALANGRTALVTAADAVICADAAQSGEPAEAEAACRRALAAYQKLGDAIGEGQLVAVFARNLLELGRKADARVLVENAEPRVRRVGANRGLVRLLRAIANIEQKSSNNARALVVAGEAASIARALANPDVLGPALSQLASAELEAGHIDNARSLYTEAIAVAKAAGYWARAAQHLQNLALLHLRGGRFAEGLPHIEEALSLFHKVHESYDIAWALDTAGLIALNMNELDKAQAFVEEGIAVRLKNHLIGGQSRQNLADVLLAKGNTARALAEAQRAVDEFHRNADHGEVFALEVLSRAQLASNDPKEALATADHAFASEDPSRREYLQQMLVPTRARARYALGERAVIPELARVVASGPSGPDGFGFRLALGELIARDGDPRRGRALLSALVTEAHKAGDELTTAQANQLLATLPR